MIRQDRLEEQLVAAIKHKVLRPGTIYYAVKCCEAELRKRLTSVDHEESMTVLSGLRKDLEDRNRRRARLIEAIEAGEGSRPSLTD
jgi:hypothetical protein